MTAKIIELELALSDPGMVLRYLEKKKRRAAVKALESIIDNHLWRKSTPRRLLRERRWPELASLLGSAYAYHADVLFRAIQGDGRPALSSSECHAYSERCSILRALADIAKAHASNT